MNVLLLLVYGLLIFLGTVLASFPFGFLRGFKEARGVPLSERTLARLKPPEYLLEAGAAILITATLFGHQSSEPLLHGLGAFVVAGLISFFLEARPRLMSIKEFVWRSLVALFVCLPLGMYFGSAFQPGV